MMMMMISAFFVFIGSEEKSQLQMSLLLLHLEIQTVTKLAACQGYSDADDGSRSNTMSTSMTKTLKTATAGISYFSMLLRTFVVVLLQVDGVPTMMLRRT